MYAPETSGSSIFLQAKQKSRYIRKRITAREFPHFSYSPMYVTASNNLKPKLQPMSSCNVFSFHYVSATIQLYGFRWYLNPFKVYHMKQMFVKAFAYFVSSMGILFNLT